MSKRETLKAAMAPTPECLSAEQLELLLDGKRSNSHLAECARCQAELALLKSFEIAAPLPDEGAAVAWISAHLDRHLEAIKSPPRGSLSRLATSDLRPQRSWFVRMFGVGGMRWVVPATAMAAVVIAAVIALRPAKEPELQANNGDHQQEIYRSQEIQVVAPAGELRQVPGELRWQAFAGTAVYKVVLMEIDHSQLWASETTQPAATIPVMVRAKMLPGKPILWQVTALNAQSQVLGTSQVQRFVFVGGR